MNFTYLIGAGASAQTLPLITNFADRLGLYTKELLEYKFENDRFPIGYREDKIPSECIDALGKDLNWLIKEVKNHSSIDTFARKLHLTKQFRELYKLKYLVSDFLLFEQYIKGIDKRYDAFFATILDNDSNGNLKLPDNINILSWNYDKQIEFSFGQFYDKKDHISIEDFLKIYPRKDLPKNDSNGFNVIKLNGTIGGTLIEDKYYPIKMDYSKIKDSIDIPTKDVIIFNILSRHVEMTDNLITENYHELNKKNPTILYSWENSNFALALKEQTFNAISNTNRLVIIGYSFPTFNRRTDRSILENMNKLTKIYLQSPTDTIEGVNQRLKSLLNKTIEIELITNVEEFYIPFEY